MIFCLLGTSPYGFSRLAAKLDSIAKNLNQTILVQCGYTKYNFLYCEYFDFIEREKIHYYLNNAHLVISQGGYGSLTDALALKKKIIAVPRYVKLKETKDDQDELVKFYEEKKYLLGCYDISLLESQVRDVLNDKYFFEPYKSETKRLIKDLVKDYINGL